MIKKYLARSAVIGLLTFAIFIVMGQVAYADTYVTVTGTIVNVRSSPVINDYNRVTQVPQGTRVNIVGASGDFFRGIFPGIGYAYIAQEWVRFYSTTGVITEPSTWVFDIPDTAEGNLLSFALENDTFRVVSYYGNWYGVLHNGGLAFIDREHLNVPYFVTVPRVRFSSNETTTSNDSVYDPDMLDDLVARAKRYLGRPWRSGAVGPYAFDCSGFVIYLLRPLGVSLPRRSRDMASSGTHVARSDLRVGDLTFFATSGNGTISHVALYIGNGQVIHSTSPPRGVLISCINTGYWARTYVTARRVL